MIKNPENIKFKDLEAWWLKSEPILLNFAKSLIGNKNIPKAKKYKDYPLEVHYNFNGVTLEYEYNDSCNCHPELTKSCIELTWEEVCQEDAQTKIVKKLEEENKLILEEKRIQEEKDHKAILLIQENREKEQLRFLLDKYTPLVPDLKRISFMSPPSYGTQCLFLNF